MASEILHSILILFIAVSMMALKCFKGITVNAEVCKKYAYESAGLATALNPILGYAVVADLVKEMLNTKESLPQIILRKNLLTETELKKILDPSVMTKPSIAKK
jgi:aspartate ammonia-lyase